MNETIEAIRAIGFWRVAFYRTLYRPLMRAMHRYYLHYAPPCYPERDTVLWCQWCGLRYRVPKLTTPPALQPSEQWPECSVCRRRHGSETQHPCE